MLSRFLNSMIPSEAAASVLEVVLAKLSLIEFVTCITQSAVQRTGALYLCFRS